MNTYKIEVQINTAHHVLMLGDGIARTFSLGGFEFSAAQAQFDKRPGFRYFASKELSADNHDSAYQTFMKDLHKVTDAMAFYFSQPVSVEYWNILIKKDGDEKAYFGCYRLEPAVSLRDLSVLSEGLEKTVEKVFEEDSFYNTAWLFNNASKIDSVDFDPGTYQLGLCQLVESLAEKETVPACDKCGRREYTRTSRADIEQMLGTPLYQKLYGGSDILRHRLAHGSLVGVAFLENKEIEEAILKISERVNIKYGIQNKVSEGVVDRIRGTYTWHGSTYAVKPDGKGLEACLAAQLQTKFANEGALAANW